MKTFILKTLSFALLISYSITFAKETPLKTNSKKQTIKVALLLDTSNSMDGLINQAKTQLWEIVNDLSYAKCGTLQPNLEIALYEYGNSNLPAREGYIRQVLQFSSDLDKISEKLFSLTTNGGNEFCGQVILSSIQELSWSKNTKDLQVLFIAGNEPFTQGKINYKYAITDAKEKGIVVNTIFCGNYSNGVSGMWKDGADLGNGDYLTINSDKKLVHVVTPYDDEIIILNKKLNDTYIYYGVQGYSSFVSQKKQDDNAATLNEEVVVKRAVSKSSRLYDNSNWDLVDANKKKVIDFTKIEKKQLPKELQNKSETELKTYVNLQAKKRSEIQEKIKTLHKKRNNFITNKQKQSTNKDELNSVMIKAIKRQAKLKNYTW